MKITHWTIKYTTEDGSEHYVSEVPDWVADDVDEFLTSIEEECLNQLSHQVKFMLDVMCVKLLPLNLGICI